MFKIYWELYNGVKGSTVLWSCTEDCIEIPETWNVPNQPFNKFKAIEIESVGYGLTHDIL